METFEARIKQVEDNHYLELDCVSNIITISLTEDKPIDVKDAFNELILILKKKEFCFDVKNPGQDLFSMVSIEYISQLNKDLVTIRGELIAHGLVTQDVEAEQESA